MSVAYILQLRHLLIALGADIRRVAIVVVLAEQGLTALRAHHDLAFDQLVAQATLGQWVIKLRQLNRSHRVPPIQIITRHSWVI